MHPVCNNRRSRIYRCFRIFSFHTYPRGTCVLIRFRVTYKMTDLQWDGRQRIWLSPVCIKHFPIHPHVLLLFRPLSSNQQTLVQRVLLGLPRQLSEFTIVPKRIVRIINSADCGFQYRDILCKSVQNVIFKSKQVIRY